jgi:SSS family solute:Na+ symporter
MDVFAQEAPADPSGLRIDLAPVDVLLLVLFFVWVIGIGFALRKAMSSSLDFFLAGRSLPAWITGLAFISANLGALEILGQSATGAQYGASTVHYYLIGAIPAMVFLGIFMMPFYYGSKVRSVPEYLRLRYDKRAHLINAVTYVAASLLIAGVNLFALAVVIEALLGIPMPVAVVAGALFVLSYILLGGVTSAIYTEVLQFFVIIAGLIPLTYIALKASGGVDQVWESLRETKGEQFVNPWSGTGPGGDNVFGDVFGIVFGLGFALSFAYWTTNFAEVQRAMSAKDDNAARMTPIIGAFPKLVIPLIVILPGMAAVTLIPNLGAEDGLTYNQALPAMMDRFLPEGVLGVAITGLVAAFMAGMAANVSSFNAVFTYDIWQDYIRPGRPDAYYLKVGRWATVVGVFIGIGTAFLVSGFGNIAEFFQVMFSWFNVPLFVTFILGMFFKRVAARAGFWGILVGTVASVSMYGLYQGGVIEGWFRSALHYSMWSGLVALVAGGLAILVASRGQAPKPDDQLHGLVYGMAIHDVSDTARHPWYRRPVVMGTIILLLSFAFYILIAVL